MSLIFSIAFMENTFAMTGLLILLSLMGESVFTAFIEFSVYKLGGMNVILCALLAQVVAFRFASFGYVPAQSYLLFGSLFLNIFIIYFAEHFIRFIKKIVQTNRYYEHSDF